MTKPENKQAAMKRVKCLTKLIFLPDLYFGGSKQILIDKGKQFEDCI